MEEKIFTLQEARALLPWLNEAVQDTQAKIEAVKSKNLDPEETRSRINRIIQHWAETVLKLGGQPKQLFTVDFNSGKDYYCWEFPEDDLYYRHDYDLGYRGRHRIEEES